MSRRTDRRAWLLLTLVAWALILWQDVFAGEPVAPIATAFASQFEQTAARLPMSAAPDVAILEPKPLVAKTRRVDPYKGWQTWCESAPMPCSSDADCTDDRTGRTRQCFRPFWAAKGSKDKICAIPRFRRSQRRTMEAHLQAIVAASSGRGGNEEELGKFIGLIALRESTLRPWKQHRMSEDVRYSKSNWAQHYAELAPKNRHYVSPDRWQGWGLLGQQSVTFAPHWDEKAPPEILCKPAIAVGTYLHCARRTHLKQRSLGIDPTWETLHAACSGGKVRPKGPSPDFRARAHRVGLDPDQRVPLAWLGVSPGKSVEARNATLRLLEYAVATSAPLP